MKKLILLATLLLSFTQLFSQDWQIYKSGNYTYVKNVVNDQLIQGGSNTIEFRKILDSDTEYRVFKDGIDQLSFAIDVTDMKDINNVTFTLETFEIFKETNTSFSNPRPYYQDVTENKIPNEFIVTKFGRNGNVGTSLTFVSISGNYQTPLTTQSLEILSSNAADTSAGLGAQKVAIEGLDNLWNIQMDTVSMNGLTPVLLNKQFIRIHRAFVIESGTYATTIAPSHLGQITLRGAGAGVTWFIIDTFEETATGFGIGQSQIGAYSIPAGYTAYLLSKTFSVEANKPASIYFFKRENSDDTTTPFTGTMRLFEQNDGIEIPFTIVGTAALNTIKGPAELGFFAKTAVGTASVSVEFQLLVKKNM